MKSIHLPLLVTDPTLNLLLEDYRLRSLLAQEDVVAAGVARKVGLLPPRTARFTMPRAAASGKLI